MGTFDPKDPKIQENLPKIKKLLFDENLLVYFVPSSFLRQTIAKGVHPLVQGMVRWIQEAFLEGKGVIVQKRIVWDLINDKLDEKNAFVFSNGDFRVTWQSSDNTSDGIIWDDKSLKNDL